MSAISLRPSAFLSNSENRQADAHLLKNLKTQYAKLQGYIATLTHRLNTEDSTALDELLSPQHDKTVKDDINEKIHLFKDKSSKTQEKIAQVQSQILKIHTPSKLAPLPKAANKEYGKLKALRSKIDVMKKVYGALKEMPQEPVQDARKLLNNLPKDVLDALGKDMQKYHPSKKKALKLHGDSWGSESLKKQPRLAITLKKNNGRSLLQNHIQKVTADMASAEQKLLPYFKAKAEAFSKKVISDKFSHEVLEKIFLSLEPEVQKLVSHQPPYYGSGISSAAKQHETLGAHQHPDGSVSFAVFAPNAEKVKVTITKHGQEELEKPINIPMQKDLSTGVWSATVEDLPEGSNYYYKLHAGRTKEGSPIIRKKADPYGFGIAKCPDDIMAIQSVVRKRPHEYQWKDAAWIENREKKGPKPMNIYELQPNFWKRDQHNRPLNWRELAHEIVGHCKEFGFTHIEIMGATDYTTDKEMGCYQVHSFFASDHRLGTMEEMQGFVDYLHQNSIGVLVDWVPAHFCIDSTGLEQFDGSQLYEKRNFIQDDDKLHHVSFEKNSKTPTLKKSRHPDWNTWEFDFSHDAARNLLYSSADFWLSVLHIDGIRVDAVTSMFMLNYSREKRDRAWFPSNDNDFKNHEAMDFVRNLNAYVRKKHRGVEMFAEESSGFFHGLTDQVDDLRCGGQRGYGFDKFWNMGWMNRTLKGFRGKKPGEKIDQFDEIIHGFNIARTQPTVYEISHDEVAYDKESVLGKMAGDEETRFAKSRNLLAYQMCMPGAKLGMMGNEFAQSQAWTHYKEGSQPIGVLWKEMEKPRHKGVAKMMKRLGKLYSEKDALWFRDGKKDGTMHEHIDKKSSVLAYRRRGIDPFKTLLCAHNFSSTALKKYRIPLPKDGFFSDEMHVREIFNSDDAQWCGRGQKNERIRIIRNKKEGYIEVDLPPNATVIFEESSS